MINRNGMKVFFSKTFGGEILKNLLSQQKFIYLKSTIETLETCEICSESAIKTTE